MGGYNRRVPGGALAHGCVAHVGASNRQNKRHLRSQSTDLAQGCAWRRCSGLRAAFFCRISARRVRNCASAVLTAVRFWGWTENEREQGIAEQEKENGAPVPGFGKSHLSEEMQGAAFRNSLHSQLNFGTCWEMSVADPQR